jgi:16S rRNA (guanine(1405)-N(7))-methyltransferase
MPDQNQLDALVQSIQTGPRYRAISLELVRRIGAQELAKGRSLKDAIKATRSKLHQVGGAYQETPIPYARLLAELETLPGDLADPALQAFCRRVMALHASTRERLPILESVYRQTLAKIGPLRSVLDLACGLNPLALPWLPLAPGAPYYACDIYTDLVSFVGRFLSHTGIPGQAQVCDLLEGPPQQPVHLALALKTIPCLEQVDKQVGLRLLEGVQAENLLVSFPSQSLGGRSKGMVENYAAHFSSLVAGKPWAICRFDLPGELFFLIRGSAQ